MNNLRELRKNKKLPLKAVAQDLDLTIGALSNYEIERREIPLDLLVKFAKYYNVSVDYILGIEKPVQKNDNIELTGLKLEAFKEIDHLSDFELSQAISYLKYLNQGKDNSNDKK